MNSYRLLGSDRRGGAGPGRAEAAESCGWSQGVFRLFWLSAAGLQPSTDERAGLRSVPPCSHLCNSITLKVHAAETETRAGGGFTSRLDSSISSFMSFRLLVGGPITTKLSKPGKGLFRSRRPRERRRREPPRRAPDARHQSAGAVQSGPV